VHIKGFHVATTLLLALLTGGSLISLLTLESNTQRQTNIAAAMALLGARSYSFFVVHTPVIFTMLWFLTKHTTLPVYSYALLTLIMVLS
jgi:peptidoglycan/LPS O-acetylase OafA/YrhL